MSTQGSITRSLAISSLFPKTRHSVDEMRRTLAWLAGRGFGMVEFYAEPGHDAEINGMLRGAELESIFVAILALKGEGVSLCATDEDARRSAVSVLCRCIDRAAVLGCRAVMINSGGIPANPSLLEQASESYVRSVLEAYDHIETAGLPLDITLEPGDSCVASMQLIGPTERAIQTAEAIRRVRPGYRLTMDVAHLREEGEDILPALSATLPHCGHVHLCNCLLDDPSHPMYGDRHVDFDYPGACFDYADFERIYHEIRAMYIGRGLIVTLEAECRAEDTFAWFEKMLARCAFLTEGDA